MATRDELKQRATAIRGDAQMLCNSGSYETAAYLCGYVVELGLKACICKKLGITNYPERALRGGFKTHQFDELLLLAGLSEAMTAAANPPLFANWSLVAGWSPDWRYRAVGTTTRSEVEAILKALDDQHHGVLQWIKKRW